MPQKRKRKLKESLAESSTSRRARKLKVDPGSFSSDPASYPSDQEKSASDDDEEEGVVELQQEISKYTCSTLHGYSYPYVYAKDGVMVNKQTKELAERVAERQVELPSIDLLNGIHMVGANRLFKQHEGITHGLFRRSALFALGVLMEEWAKQTAEDLKWVENVDNSVERDSNRDTT